MLIPEHSPIHPGVVLLEEFVKPLGITQTKLAEDIGVPIQRVNLLIKGKRNMTPDTALRLSRYLGTTPDVWLNLQQVWDVWHELHGARAREIKAVRPLRRLARTG